jgi:hypothetical protein
MRDKCVAKGLQQINATVRVYDSKAREIKKADDFAYIKESVLVLASEGVGVRTTLEEALSLRNKWSAHEIQSGCR